MRLRLALALVLLASVPAVAQDTAAPATLRPSIRADTPASSPATATPARPAAVPETPAVPAFSPIPPQPTADQCRTRCAQDYYFCLAENEIQDCAPTWGQCRLTCSTTATASSTRLR